VPLAPHCVCGFQRVSVTRGRFQDTVIDVHGSAVPNAMLVVTSAPDVAVNLATQPEGFYFTTELVPGTHLRVRIQGFSVDLANNANRSNKRCSCLDCQQKVSNP
jgi:hypothetical protein